MSEFNQMVDVTNKLFYYLDTFEINSGRETARQIILDTLRKDAIENKMRQLRAQNLYEKGAREYYAKYGTQNEF
jgi:hypothetical protein